MNIKRKNAQNKPYVQILGRKTDANSRTLYRIRWLHDNNRQSWEPIQHLKQYLKQINQFQQNYQQRTTNWNLSSSLGSCLQNEHSYLKKGEQLNKYQSEYGELKQAQQISSRFILSGKFNSFEEQIQTDDKLQAIQQQKIIQQQQIRQPAKQNSSINSLNIDQSLLKTARLLRRSRRSNQTYGNVSNRIKKIMKKAKLVRQMQVKEIQIIYSKNKVWYAKVLTAQNQTEQILRDELRILNPSLLLTFYQKQLEQKVKATFFLQ